MVRSQRSILIITDIFPPRSGVGIHRTLGLCQHLSEQGWVVTVITTHPKADEALDCGLLTKVPRDVRIVRTATPDLPALAARVLKRHPSVRIGSARAASDSQEKPGSGRQGRLLQVVDWLSWWLHVPDSSCGWFLPAVWAGLGEGKRHKPDIIFSSAPRWTSHLVAAALSRLLRVPWVADFRDPWCGSHWRSMPYKAHRAVDNWLEGIVVNGATKITFAWDGIRRFYLERHPERGQDMTTVLNGFDPGELDMIQPERLDESRCVLVHAGTFYGPRSPIPLFLGLGALIESSPEAARRLLVVLVGSQTYNGRHLLDIAAEHGVASLVRTVPFVAHRRALEILKGADVAMLFGQSGSEALASVPAKAYEYVGCGKPVLAVGAGEEVCDILLRGGCRLWRLRSSDARECAAVLKEIIVAFQKNELLGTRGSCTRKAFTRSRMATNLEVVLKGAMNASQKK